LIAVVEASISRAARRDSASLSSFLDGIAAVVMRLIRDFRAD
jgi:hypothetical protein